MPHPTLPLFLAAGLLFAPGALADDPRVDPKTGRDQGNYPPPRHFDHLHMKLQIDIPDMGKPMFDGVETLTVTPIGRERKVLDLDAGPLKIKSDRKSTRLNSSHIP